MISNPCTRTDIGGPSPARKGVQPRLICGVSDDVIQVSITSGSGDAEEDPHAGHAGGIADSGSTGSDSSAASTGAEQAVQNHAGNGTPYRRCREMFQSHFSPSIQSSSLRRMNSGMNSSSAA